MKLPASRTSRWGRLSAAAGVLSLVIFGSSAGAARSAVPAFKTGPCQPGIEGHPGTCSDPIGDVKGSGPDLTRVAQYEWGVIWFQVGFAKAPPLARRATYTDELSVSLVATGKTTRRYLLTVSAADLKHQVLQRLPNGKRVTLPGLAQPVSGKLVTLGVSLKSIGDPYIVRYRVQAARVLPDGTVAGSDYVPNTGTMVWHGTGALE